MTDKHTPGPWRRNSDGWNWIDGKDTEPICHFPDEQVLQEHSKANIDLICAAPDLLAACEMSLRWFLKHSKHAETIIDGKWVDHPMVTMLEKAIDKARGES